MSFATRLFYAAITFGMLFLAFVAYQLVAVPLLEGTVTTQVVLKPHDGYETIDEPYDRLLANYFPPGSWERERAHILKNDQFLMLVEKWKPKEDAKLRIWPCTIIYRADGLAAQPQASSRTWILKAREGAVLQLQDGVDVTRGKIGKLIGGVLQGNIEVTSPETSPGAGDAIQLATSNLFVNQQQIRTSEDIHFQWGPHRGSGRGLLMRFMAPTENQDLPFHANLLQMRLDTIHEIQWMMHAGEAFKKPVPVVVRSEGSLDIDMRGGIARIDDQLTISRTAQTQQDELQCRELTVRFSSLNQPAKDVQLERVAAVGEPARFRARRIQRGDGEPRTYEIAAPTMEYQMLAQTFVASGPGQLQVSNGTEIGTGNADGQPPQPELVAEWQRIVRWGPHGDQMQLDINEGARCWTAAGSVTSRRLQAHFDLPDSTTPTATQSNPFESRLVPRQIVATGEVALTSKNVDARTEQLQVLIRSSNRLPPANDAMQLRAPDNSRGRIQIGSTSSQRCRISGQAIALEVEQRGRQMQLTDATIDGSVVCQTYRRDQGQPTSDDLELTGNRLVLRGFTESSGVAQLSGMPAHIRAKKLALRGPVVQLDRSANRIWVEGAGTATLPLPEKIAQRYPRDKAFADIRWSESMQFDGQSITCQHQVDIRGPTQSIRADQVAVRLVRMIHLSDLDLKGSDVALQQIEGVGNVLIENRTLGTQGIESMDSARLQQLTYVFATGELAGQGPGSLESIRRGRGTLWPAGGAQRQPVGLNYLKMEFQNQVVAHLGHRMATFSGGVAGIYGSVSDWTQRLSTDARQLTGDQVLLRADQLRMMQIQQSANLAPIDVKALGNTSMESAQFVAQAHELKYEQAKGMFSLMGKGQIPAKIWDKSKPNSPQYARTIRFWPQKNAFKAEVQELNFELGNQAPSRR